MVVRAVALLVLSVGFAAPAYADATDDAFLTNLNTSGMNYGPPEKAIQVAKTSSARPSAIIPKPATRT